MKILLALASFMVYMPILYFIFKINFNIMFIDLIFYTFIVNILVYVYKYYHTVGLQSKTKKLVIYGAGKAGLQLQREFLI
jgi:FlaA1/EpsC-like NDP-sugar epimerase